MEYRIKEKIFEDGHKYFYPQKRWFLFWHYYYERNYIGDVVKVKYNDLNTAKDDIESNIAQRKWKHCIYTRYYRIDDGQ